jgi:Leucine-rich repeat (LRR) protein
MNIRALAPNDPKAFPKATTGQAGMGRARASWSRVEDAQFHSSKADASITSCISMASIANDEQLSVGLAPRESLSMGGAFAANGHPGPLVNQCSMLQSETVATERLPEWLRDLHDIFVRSNGVSWKEKQGWPSTPRIPKGQMNFSKTEIYGVSRPFDRPTEVTSIDLCWNELSGDVSEIEGLWNMPALEVLHLGANKLHGTLTGSVRRLVMLRELHLYRNGLQGPLPPEISHLKQLSSVWLFENMLTGTIEHLGELSGLVDLRLNSNRFSGPIPNALANCTNLKVLNLQKNKFENSIPESIFSHCCRLRDLRLWSNKLTGPLSPEVSCLRVLESLFLQQNELSWVIPETLGRCTSLKKLDLSNNNFRGALSPSFGNLTCLDTFCVANNIRVSGTFPSQVADLESLTLVDLSGTALEGLDDLAVDMLRKAQGRPLKVVIEGFSRNDLI